MTPALAGALVACVMGLSAILVRAGVLRARLARLPHSYPCLVSVVSGDVPRLPAAPFFKRFTAEWQHDVLLLHHGFPVGRVLPLATREAVSDLEPASPGALKQLGPGAARLLLCLDDDSLVAVSVASNARRRLVGPFLTLALGGLPPAARDRGQR